MTQKSVAMDAGPRRTAQGFTLIEVLIAGELDRWVSRATGPPNAGAPFRWDMSQGIDFRHRGRASVIFGDNHVESDAPAQLVAPSESVRRRWNYDHRPHDENWR